MSRSDRCIDCSDARNKRHRRLTANHCSVAESGTSAIDYIACVGHQQFISMIVLFYHRLTLKIYIYHICKFQCKYIYCEACAALYTNYGRKSICTYVCMQISK